MTFGDSSVSIGTFCIILGGFSLYDNNPIDPAFLLICGIVIFLVGTISMFGATTKPKKNVGPILELNKSGGN